MNKQTQISADIIDAMKNKSQCLNTLRSLKNALTNYALGLGNASKSLSDNEVISVIRKEIKKREDSIEAFNKGGILKTYLPEELTEAQINTIVSTAILETSASTKKDMGKAIKRALELSAGRVENKIISQKIGEILK